MDDATCQALRELLAAQDVAALSTLHERRDGDEPAVSMVPVAWLPGPAGTADPVVTPRALIHVSALAAHTRDLQRTPCAGLMLMAPRQPGDDPQALPRLTLQLDAAPIDPASAGYDLARAAYLRRFPRAEQTFALGDFALWRLVPRSARFVAGFGRAHPVPMALLHACLG